nr:MAG TPA: hypothetical protein [Caudoviricetes sp.]
MVYICFIFPHRIDVFGELKVYIEVTCRWVLNDIGIE